MNKDANNLDPKEEDSIENVKKDAIGLFESTKKFLSELLDIRSDTDRDQTIEHVKNDIPFKGHNAWILIFSIFVASIGLNVSSTAVVIGAMLISPLMGPIVGVGLSIAINDIDTLKRSLVNLGVMVGLSVLTATIYFTLSPLTELTPELESRTAPTILDVFVAISGGMALIVARTKKGTIPNAIAGVAIATALMPPLCTVGYGLAEWEPKYAAGAMYLFTINAIFIALSTFIVAKLLRFPMIRYANSAKRKRIAQFASFIAILMMIPATWTFVNVLDRSGAKREYHEFLLKNISENEGLYLRKDFYDYENKTIKLFFDGEISDATISALTNELKTHERIKNFDLKINGNKSTGIDQISKANDRYIVELDRLEIENKSLVEQIESLQSQLSDVENRLRDKNATSKKNRLPFLSTSKDAKIRFPDLAGLGFGEILQSNFIKMDTAFMIYPTWRFQIIDSLDQRRNENLRKWMQKELKIDTLLINKRY